MSPADLEWGWGKDGRYWACKVRLQRYVAPWKQMIQLRLMRCLGDCNYKRRA